MEDNAAYFTQKMGPVKYKETLDTLTELKASEEKRGQFLAIAGAVDTRPDALKGKPLSNGFDSGCGVKGSKLSGGQKQRVAIARTILREPGILILDEATSALDEDSQKKVQVALSQAMAGRTTITIAHRMSTIEGCDRIYVLEEGRVVEEGAMADLKAQGGAFAKLAQNKQE